MIHWFTLIPAFLVGCMSGACVIVLAECYGNARMAQPGYRKSVATRDFERDA